MNDSIDYSKVTNIQFENVNFKDYPDFVDAFICAADYDGNSMSDEMLDILNADTEYVYEQLLKSLH